MIVITGAAGFIGSCLITKLNDMGIKDLVIVDDFSKYIKYPNFIYKQFIEKIERSNFFQWFKSHTKDIQFIIHIGARTDTTEFNTEIFNELNLNYSKKIWKLCSKYNIPLIYASSAATYGDGLLGYKDDHKLTPKLKPLNPYGISKNEFDKWILKQKSQPPKWFGLKFFNVFGPNEYHKARMASVIFHSFKQIKFYNKVKLFKSANPNYKDGQQIRDFVYVKDVVNVIYFLINHPTDSGIYNLGTGKARTFIDLSTAVFNSLNISPNIEFVNIPEDIKNKYQYFTEADMTKLYNIGYSLPFYSLENAISDYVQEYLIFKKIY